MTEAALTGTDDDLRELATWLRDEDELRGRVRLRDAPIREGEMGAAIDALTIALGGGGAGAVMIRSVFTYLSTRRKAVVLDLDLKDGDKHFKAKLANNSNVDEVLAQVDKFFDE
ncbi:effector-associated constant component EACC1 [Actinokineospora terrae]|uniref:Uncharacterized protein n=1 Tax=Actinokineospora terrae TaxID=155974 RepID=A0A1H9WVK7_9PSEU|nr:hypothetical protein [Actinokineospora terrae]SES37972.1 hypothetical protein SAMN04487818_111271 [Actinokineospora terrae]